MHYQELLDRLEASADENYRSFHKRLLKNDNVNVLGVRVPILRKIAKDCVNDVEDLLSFPDEYYEVTFVKLTAVSLLKWDDFIKYVDKCIPLIDNWATCDCFAPKCIKGHTQEFLKYTDKYIARDGEFFQRFALTTLFHYYVTEEYLDKICEYLKRADTSLYYVHMAAAWLTAEVLVRFYGYGVEFLKSGTLDKKTHNKAIQKARESFRLSEEQKNFLKGMKK